MFINIFSFIAHNVITWYSCNALESHDSFLQQYIKIYKTFITCYKETRIKCKTRCMLHIHVDLQYVVCDNPQNILYTYMSVLQDVSLRTNSHNYIES